VSMHSLDKIFENVELGIDGPLLSIRDLSVSFGGVEALSNVTFDVMNHEVVSVIGPNGAGKSTLLNAVSGLVGGQVTGEIMMGNISISGKRPLAVANTGIGRSFQDPPLVEKETVLENVMLGQHMRLNYSMVDQILRRKKVNKIEQEAIDNVQTLLEFMGLSSYANSVIGGLPYGVRKLVDISRAVASGPRLLLLDEPTSGLDIEEQAIVGKILNELHSKTSVAILVVEHHMHVVRSVSDRVVGLESGRIVAIGEPDKVLATEEFKLINGK